jgi:hypothetical protein
MGAARISILRPHVERKTGWSRRTARLAAPITMIAVLAGIGVVAQSANRDDVAVAHLNSGVAWFAGHGLLSLVDGDSGTVLQRIAVAGSDHALSVVQDDSSALVLDRTSGKISRFAGGSYRRRDMAGDTAKSPDTKIYPTSEGVYVANQVNGFVLHDRQDLRETARLTSAGTGSAGVDGNAHLWVITADGHRLGKLSAGRIATTITLPSAAGGAELVPANGRTVVVERSNGRFWVQDNTTLSPEHQIGGTLASTVGLTGATDQPWLMLVEPTGLLRVIDTGSGSVVSRVDLSRIAGAGPTSTFGPAVERDQRIFVPDFATGKMLAVDLSQGAAAPLTRALDLELAGPTPGLGVFVHDGHVWFDDQSSARAGVIDSDTLTVRTVAKYGNAPITDLGCDLGVAGNRIAGKAMQVRLSGPNAAKVTTAHWEFNGGVPSSSDIKEPTVVWPVAGKVTATVRATVGGQQLNATCEADIDPAPAAATTTSAPTTTTTIAALQETTTAPIETSVTTPTGTPAQPSPSTGTAPIPRSTTTPSTTPTTAAPTTATPTTATPTTATPTTATPTTAAPVARIPSFNHGSTLGAARTFFAGQGFDTISDSAMGANSCVGKTKGTFWGTAPAEGSVRRDNAITLFFCP